MNALEQRLEIYVKFVVVENIDLRGPDSEKEVRQTDHSLTFNLLVRDEFDCTTDTVGAK